MTDRELHERASELFLELRTLPDEERRHRLAELDQDGALRREVASLLDHDTMSTTPEDESDDPDLYTPEQIGPYRVLEPIGRGGSGYVLLARQTEPVERHVAIKIVPHAAFSPSVAARFEFERRALERTTHPNITRILDTGRTPEGLPYLVMEYVEGATITDYCTERSLPLRERIGLVLDVADAVQHAHQRGVIHRDLKPTNILVTEVNGKPVPRVLDFGIAKPIGDAFGSTPAVTGELPVGTPAYMAPEQTGGRTVDTRADVYALGAVLYELASARPPIEPGDDPVQHLTRIRTVVPQPASRVRSRHAARFDGDRVPATVLADLDSILTRALEKSPDRRYPTVAAFADDLRRLLRREPIEARPHTIAYRAARFAERNRPLAAAMLLALLASALGVGGLAVGLVVADRHRREAIEQTQAQLAINRFLTEDLLAAASPFEQGEQVTALELLHRASRRIGPGFEGRPLIAAAVHHTIGSTFMQLGAFDDAETHLARAVDLRRRTLGPDAPDTVRSEIAAASLIAHRQQYADAAPKLAEVVDRARKILGPDNHALYTALSDLGTTYESLDRGPEAIELLHEALDGRRRLLGDRDPRVIVTTSNLAQAYDRVGETERALELTIDAFRLAESLDEPPPMLLLGLNNNIGATYQDLGRQQDAAPYLRRADRMASDWLGPEHPASLTIRANLAGLELHLGDTDRSTELYLDIIETRSRVLGPDAHDTLSGRYGYCNSLWHAGRFQDAADAYTVLLDDTARALGDDHWLTVQARSSYARALRDAGHHALALPLARLAAEQFIALYGEDHPRARNTHLLAIEIEEQIGLMEAERQAERPGAGG